MGPETVLAAALLAALVIYALSGGADFGGGMWDLFASGPRARAQREAIEDAIAPIWEANHVWLIVVVVILFSAFPPAFAALMIALHVPLTAALLGIVARGSAFVFRKYDVTDDHVHRRWSRVFGVASLVTPFCLGLALGGVASGDIRVADGRVTSGFVAGWTTPFAVGCGLFAQTLFAFLAAVYLTVDTEGRRELQEDFRRRALLAGLATVPVAAAVFLLARAGAPAIPRALTAPGARLVPAAAAVAAGVALGALARRRYRWARAAAILEVTLVLLGWALAQWPYAIVPDVTFAAAATAPPTVRLLVWALAAGAVVLFPSFVYLFRLFKSRAAG